MGRNKKDSKNNKSKAYEGWDLSERHIRCAYYILSFILPIILLMCILAIQKFYPFGDKTLFIMDMKNQYLEFFASLRDSIGGNNSLFFSWSRSMGGNYLGVYAYYLASPLSWLTVLFKIENLHIAIFLLLILKIGLCGMSFAVFAEYEYKRCWIQLHKNEELKHERIWRQSVLLLLVVCYSLMSYNMVYSLSIMWLDGVILLPMALLGLEKILDGKKGLLFLVSVAALFICNYYTGYMVGLFTILFYLWQMVIRIDQKNKKEYGMKSLKIVGLTVLAIGISSPVIISVLKDLQQGKFSTPSYIPATQVNFTIQQLLGKLQSGVYDSITNSGLPSIHCGWIVMILMVFYFFLKQIHLKEKIASFVVLLILALSFMLTKWDIVWHCFRYPTWFPYRYAFVCSFFMIFLALRTICCVQWDKMFRSLYYIKRYVLAVIAILLVVSLQMVGNGKKMFEGLEHEFGYVKVSDYQKYVQSTHPVVEQIKKENNDLYRMNQNFEWSKNDPMLLGYNGLYHYSSAYNAAILQMTKKLGFAQTATWSSGKGSTFLTDSLFSIKYIMDNKNRTYPQQYKKVDVLNNNDHITAYENTNALPFVYSTKISNAQISLESGNPFHNQNTYFKCVTGQNEDCFIDSEYTLHTEEGEYSIQFTAVASNPYYLYLQTTQWGNAEVYVNEEYIGNTFSTDDSANLYLGYFEEGEEIVVSIHTQSWNVSGIYLVYLNMEYYETQIEKLKDNGIQITNCGGGKIEGTIEVGEEEKVVTSIPFDEGWNIWVDGKKASAEKFMDTFLMLDVPSGTHQIKMWYVSPGFGIGIGICLISCLIVVIVYLPYFAKFRCTN